MKKHENFHSVGIDRFLFLSRYERIKNKYNKIKKRGKCIHEKLLLGAIKNTTRSIQQHLSPLSRISWLNPHLGPISPCHETWKKDLRSGFPPLDSQPMESPPSQWIFVYNNNWITEEIEFDCSVEKVSLEERYSNSLSKSGRVLGSSTCWASILITRIMRAGITSAYAPFESNSKKLKHRAWRMLELIFLTLPILLGRGVFFWWFFLSLLAFLQSELFFQFDLNLPLVSSRIVNF